LAGRVPVLNAVWKSFRRGGLRQRNNDELDTINDRQHL
jgi:hypothetical protein